MAFVLCSLCLVLLLIGQGFSQCHTEENCNGTAINAADDRACCLDTDEGLYYGTPESCRTCIVHGFRQSSYIAKEGKMLRIVFEHNIKGQRTSQGLDLRVDTSGQGKATEYDDYFPIHNFFTDGDIVRFYAPSDNITLEYNEGVQLKVTQMGIREKGEFLKSANVAIIDEALRIYFEKSEYSINESSATGNVRVSIKFTTNANPFTLILSTLTIEEVSTTMGLERFIDHDAFDPLSRASAVEDADFLKEVRVLPVAPFSNESSTDFTIFDDNINEEEQSFAIHARIELGAGIKLDMGMICFVVAMNDTNCSDQGAALIRIKDNDRMFVGFSTQSQAVWESVEFPEIDVVASITSEKNISMRLSALPGSNASVGSGEEGYDAIFVTQVITLEAGETDITVIIPINNDFIPEGKDCFTIELSFLPSSGRGENPTCHEDDSVGNERYPCKHTICILNDDEPFRISFVETAYSVDESVGEVSICVNLTYPEGDISPEMVHFSVQDDTSVIPSGYPHATADPPNPVDFSVLTRTDYEKQTEHVNNYYISQDTRQSCYAQKIYDDLRLEKDEYVGLKLTLGNNTVPITIENDHIVIEIIDNDRAVVELEQTFFNVSEEVKVIELCVYVSYPPVECPIEFPFDVRVSTADGTAKSDIDYILVDSVVSFHECERQECINITLVDDFMDEPEEFFNFYLTGTPDLDTRIDVTSTVGTVHIGRNNECPIVGAVRLAGGTERKGLLEICYNHTWGLVCDDEWNYTEALVVCKALRFPNASLPETVSCPAKGFNVTNDLFWLDDVNCEGTESSLFECGHGAIAMHNCNTEEAVVVECHSPPVDIQIVGDNNKSGLIQVLTKDGQWIPVCDDYWTDNDANVACKQLGYFGFGATTILTGRLDEATAVLDDVNCKGDETSLFHCKGNLTDHNCHDGEGAGVDCIDKSDIDIDFNGTDGDSSGLIALKYRGEWKPVCGDSWNYNDAQVACRQRGFSADGATAFFGNSSEQTYWLDDVRCTGDEEYLFQCAHSGIGRGTCKSNKIAGVNCQRQSNTEPNRGRRHVQDDEECSVEGETRLVREDSTLGVGEGSVEICMMGQWGSVCDDGWNIKAAVVVCRERGMLTEATRPTWKLSTPHKSSVHYWLDDIRCNGTESSLLDCEHTELGFHNCGLKERAGVICNDTEGLDLPIPEQGMRVFGFLSAHGHKYNALSANATISGNEISGTVMFTPSEDGREIEVVIEISGLKDTISYEWGISKNSNDSMEDVGFCKSEYSIYDPSNAIIRSCNYPKDCITSSKRCAVGDYSGRFGLLEGNGRRMVTENTTQLKLRNILELTFFVCNQDEGMFASGHIQPQYECEDGEIKMEVVAQQAFLGPFEVCVHNEWHRVGDHHWTKQDATVACRQLELPYEGTVAVYFNEREVLPTSQGRNVTDGADCIGDEMTYDLCKQNMVSRIVDGSEKIAGVLCQDE